ncbi:Annexin A6 [Durusdinium trenchii]|uniref:Annexin A6 n=1 Tax=Durusdinium trenchii TaxID=1381693 RepID=A0ABP0RSH8_9DINO
MARRGWQDSWPVKEEWEDSRWNSHCKKEPPKPDSPPIQATKQLSNKNNPPKTELPAEKRRRVEANASSASGSQADVKLPWDHRIGMDLNKKAPKKTVHNFLARYNCRPMKKGEDYSYTTRPSPGGFVGALHVPSWNDNVVYEGEEREDENEAERSAAEAFISDPEVIAAANRLPPPVGFIENELRKQMISNNQRPCYRAIFQKSHQYYLTYRERGCDNVLWSGNA